MVDVLKIYSAEKEISFFPGWSKPEAETSYIFFDAPLEIGGVTETGLVLHGGCYATFPDCNVSFELRISKSPGRRCLPMERIDWRSLKGGHSNIRGPQSDWSGARVSDTHLHAFDLNWSGQPEKLRKNGLTVARDVTETDLHSFEDVLAYAGKRLRINNIEVVSRPPWRYTMLEERGDDG